MEQDIKQKFFSKEDLLTFSDGKKSAQLPAPPMLMFDRITDLHEQDDKKGRIVAELDINPDLWFFACHFTNDPVMPGCLGLDAMWQLLGFYLAWTGKKGKGRALGVDEVKFTGQVEPTNKILKYQVDIKKVITKGDTSIGMANASMFCDGVEIYQAKKLKVGLFQKLNF